MDHVGSVRLGVNIADGSVAQRMDGIGDEPAELTHDQPALASCYAASAADVQLLGESAGCPSSSRSSMSLTS